jgi:hypothetical protein
LKAKFETDVLLIGLAPELDGRFAKLYAYLQNHLKKIAVDGNASYFWFFGYQRYAA